MCGEFPDKGEGKRVGALGVADAEGPTPPPVLEVGEELNSMVSRTAGQCTGQGAPAGGAGGQHIARVPTMESCGWGVAEKRKRDEGEGHRKGEARPPSPQDSCSLAEGILHHTKKQRLLRRRVTFNSESRVRVIARVAHLYEEEDEEDGEDKAAGDGDDGAEEALMTDEQMEEGDGGVGSPVGEEEETGGQDSVEVAPEGGAERERSASPCDSTRAAGSDGDKTPCGSDFGDEEEAGVEEEMTWEEEVAMYRGEGGDEPVETKTNDGPSLVNVITQALIIGLVERHVRNVGDVLRTMRESVVPGCHEEEQEEEHVARKRAHSGGQSSSPYSSDDASDADAENKPPKKRGAARRTVLRPCMVLDDAIFDKANQHIHVMLARILNNGRASLLPSTAQIGPPFVPALEFLLQSTKEAQALNEEDRRRLVKAKRM